MTETVVLKAPEVGQMVKARGGLYLVTAVNVTSSLPAQGLKPVRSHLVQLTSLMDDALGEELAVIWELEPGTRIFETLELPKGQGFDDPVKMQAFLHAVRWGASSNAEYAYIQSPFRCGVSRERYQLEPLLRAVEMPRANLLIADDVGLGKTIETGLVMQELMFRHRVHTVLIVCPAALQLQWQEQMRDKFGLEFQIIDSEKVRQLRRERGVRANPWSHFPRLITSIDYLKREKSLRSLREILPLEVTYPRRIDMLVLDEAHMAAPAGNGKYALDTQRTRAIRQLAPHCEHKLFLTATPHNGYAESFSALLELLDNQRFTKGMPPNPKLLQASMIRRLKSEMVDFDGRPLFPQRRLEALRVAYQPAEKAIHQALQQYAKLRRQRLHQQAGQGKAEQSQVLADFVLKLLKKRLFSSPEAFLKTLRVHRQTLLRQAQQHTQQQAAQAERQISWRQLQARFERFELEDFASEADDEDETAETLELLASQSAALSEAESTLLEQMENWAEQAASAGDSKLHSLLDWLRQEIVPGGQWGDQRVIIFTEYRDTLYWLQSMLQAHKLLSKERVMVLEGGMQPEAREAIKAAFQARPEDAKVRILLATDAASEGIDLQNHCHRLIHYEIPWNPNRLEQRNGRIDRHGQRFDPQIFHFVSADYQQQSAYQVLPGSLDADLEFLMRAAHKVNAIRVDLGKVGPVIAAQVEKAMLGGAINLDTYAAEQVALKARKALSFERDLRQKLHELDQKLRQSANGLEINAQSILQVVRCGLELAGQPPLRQAELAGVNGELFWMPALTHQWARCSEGLRHPHTGVMRPITFDADLVKGRDDLVLVHLNHRLVQMCLRLLRAEIWSPQQKLQRMAIQTVPDHVLDTPAVLAFARLVVIGGNRERLHEEIVHAGGKLVAGSFQQIATEGEKTRILNTASFEQPGPELQQRLLAAWQQHSPSVARALQTRMRTRVEPIFKRVAERCSKELDNLSLVMDELAGSIQQQLEQWLGQPQEVGSGQQLVMDSLLQELNSEEQGQFRRDVENLRLRLQRLPVEKAAELAAIEERFAEPQARLFPVGVIWYVPHSLVLQSLKQGGN